MQAQARICPKCFNDHLETQPCNRVVVTKAMIGITGMQCCCAKDCTDEEILREVNLQNPCGTTNGWVKVINSADDLRELKLGENCLPVQCADDPSRVHKLIIC